MVFLTQIDYQRLGEASKWMLLICGILLVLVLIPGIGIMVKGARRWLGYGPLRFQPSELAKIVLIIFMAKFLSQKYDSMKDFRRVVLPSIGILVLFMILIVKEPDFGNAMIIGLIMGIMWFVAGMRIRLILASLIVSIPVVIYLIVSEQYRLARIFAYLNPWEYKSGKGWQLVQSLISLGSGGIGGRGLGHSVQKYLYLPDSHSDFIFAILGEELGFVGTTVVVLLFLTLIWCGIKVSLRIKDLFGSYLAIGISSLIGIQALINMCVVTGLVPTKGLPLPFISYGGSSLLANCIGIGILINIASYDTSVKRKKIKATIVRKAYSV
jgi:cell division protein FtsW